ncbi:MAG: 2-oxoacid ferredoxin oxidoreductase, partial [Candidatus Heimdallarchaeota archaeon]|nr:2-oxoacid ferredoxin oxidoreductase [Candidatus Heimdallarchaeota archaeon]
HLRYLIERALNHKGFSFIDVLSPCVTFNKLNTFQWFKQRVYKLEDINFDKSNLSDAFSRSLEWGEKIPTGIFYETTIPTLDETDPVARNKIVVKEKLGLDNIDRNSIFDYFR